MFSKNKKKILTAALLATGIISLSGCNSLWGPKTPSSAMDMPPVQKKQPMYDNADAENRAQVQQIIDQTASNDDSSKMLTEPASFSNLDSCIKELNSLKVLSPKDYDHLVGSFKEVSEINGLYKQIASTASPDTIELMKMAIEAKTKVLCAKVRYNSVLSIESTLEKISGL
ncbi:hypothetical protein [Moellerella wisconsensis]|uniref:Uncharacterized protein n=2 Tax=Moellerella wisconsensis TaxID=158849 RepID=A0ACD3Y4L8_9GAMM|nr:hypothetical protein [Moellerella wisconsensis]KLN97580.1 hypothetical protein VK86_03825 [Moellerella wisconsensis]UNH23351.1 hypothetical protein MNY68_11020 [Moellerella wisconsensis]UNH26430.1 hypothetical protein MNY64_11245 [Moellerella wisconsensis]UNH29847.1 hypothetical protein MNY72_10825 [Moellerella wisconsensis]UNH38072.1 hypothetical protein MNY70_11325 [Moellerella wisconsensis]